MNIEEVNALQARAAKAVEIAKHLATISKVVKFEDIPWEFRPEVLKIGAKALTERLEGELSNLLNCHRTIEHLPITMPTINYLNTSGTNEAPRDPVNNTDDSGY